MGTCLLLPRPTPLLGFELDLLRRLGFWTSGLGLKVNSGSDVLPSLPSSKSTEITNCILKSALL